MLSVKLLLFARKGLAVAERLSRVFVVEWGVGWCCGWKGTGRVDSRIWMAGFSKRTATVPGLWETDRAGCKALWSEEDLE